MMFRALFKAELFCDSINLSLREVFEDRKGRRRKKKETKEHIEQVSTFHIPVKNVSPPKSLVGSLVGNTFFKFNKTSTIRAN